MYNFPPPYSNFYKNSVRKAKNEKPNNYEAKKINNVISNYDNNEEYNNCINILGIKLYIDDLIILFIIFILYKEKIQDNELIICLLLLLLNWYIHILKKECTIFIFSTFFTILLLF